MNNKLLDDKYLDQIKNAIEYAIETGSFDKRNIIDNAENVCVFGLGTYFNEAFEQQNVKERFHVNLLCDNNPKKWGKEFYGLKCIPPNELKTTKNVVVITMLGDPRAVQKQLDEMGIKHITHVDLSLDSTIDMPRDKNYFLQQTEKIINAYYLLQEDESRKLYANLLCLRIAPQFSEFSYEELYSSGEYFQHNLFSLDGNESFVDCGAYNGDTIMGYLEAVEYKFNNIHAFELDYDNFVALRKCIANFEPDVSKRIACINAGVWNEDKEIKYGKGVENEPAEGISLLKTDNILTAKVTQLDHALEGKRVTFIKMDIEGAEQNALKGAKNILINQKPKLAICLYHRLDDLWKIPIFLKTIVPDYKIKIRHHFYINVWATVCYAYI